MYYKREENNDKKILENFKNNNNDNNNNTQNSNGRNEKNKEVEIEDLELELEANLNDLFKNKNELSRPNLKFDEEEKEEIKLIKKSEDMRKKKGNSYKNLRKSTLVKTKENKNINAPSKLKTTKTLISSRTLKINQLENNKISESPKKVSKNFSHSSNNSSRISSFSDFDQYSPENFRTNMTKSIGLNSFKSQNSPFELQKTQLRYILVYFIIF